MTIPRYSQEDMADAVAANRAPTHAELVAMIEARQKP